MLCTTVALKFESLSLAKSAEPILLTVKYVSFVIAYEWARWYIGWSSRRQPLRSLVRISCWKVGSYLPMPSGLQCIILAN